MHGQPAGCVVVMIVPGLFVQAVLYAPGIDRNAWPT
jgi:hypothetical protein